MKDIKNLKPTEICIRATEETRHEIITLLEKLGGYDYNNKKDSWNRFDVPLYIQSDNTICGLYMAGGAETEITLSELRQMAVVEEIKPDELAALRKENEELRECLKDLHLYCLEDGEVVNGFRSKEIIIKSKNLLKP